MGRMRNDRVCNSPNDLGPVSKDRHGHGGAGLVRREGQFAKLGLLDSYLAVAVQPPTSEILAPVGVLVVDHEQREAAVFAENGTAGGARDGGAQDRGALGINNQLFIVDKN